MKKKIRRIVFALLLAAVALFPYTWGPAVAGRIARHYLDLDEKGSSSCTVDRLSLFRLKARDIRLGAVVGAPRVARVDARYTPWGLLRGRGLRLAVEGAEMDFKDLLPPAALERVVVEGSTKVLMSSLPAQEKLRAELTYRAENVAGLVEE